MIRKIFFSSNFLKTLGPNGQKFKCQYHMDSLFPMDFQKCKQKLIGNGIAYYTILYYGIAYYS